MSINQKRLALALFVLFALQIFLATDGFGTRVRAQPADDAAGESPSLAEPAAEAAAPEAAEPPAAESEAEVPTERPAEQPVEAPSSQPAVDIAVFPAASEPGPPAEAAEPPAEPEAVAPAEPSAREPAAPPRFKPGLLLQTHALVEDAPRGDELDTRATFFIRRARFMLSGHFSEMVNYFIETDLPNFGKYGDWSVDFFIQDAWMELNLHRALQLDVGLVLLPFSHHGMQGAVSLNAIDYHGKLIRYPVGGDKVSRDVGLMARGLVLDDRLEYRVSITSGVHHPRSNVLERSQVNPNGSVFSWQEPTDPRNPDDWPRLTARITFNAFEPEGGPAVGGFFYDGLYLEKSEAGVISPRKVLSVGGSVDWQRGLNAIWADQPAAGTLREVAETEDYFAISGDVFWDIPLSEDRLLAVSGQLNLYLYDHGDRSSPLAYYNTSNNTVNYTGVGIASEVGVRYDFLEPIVCLDWYNSGKVPDGLEELGDYLAIYGGVNWFWMAHAVTFKLQVGASSEGRYSADRSGVVNDFAPFGTVQAQLLL